MESAANLHDVKMISVKGHHSLAHRAAQKYKKLPRSDQETGDAPEKEAEDHSVQLMERD